jgi:hypothetical protein
MATKREKSERRAWAKLQDAVEAMEEESLRTWLRHFANRSRLSLDRCLAAVIREEIAVRSERARLAAEDAVPDLPDLSDLDEGK